MGNIVRKLPIGIQSFDKLRTENYLYVDKTEFIYQMAYQGVPYFLFGKAYLLLLVSLGFFYTLQFGFLLLNDEIVSFQMLFTCDSFCLPTFH